MPRLNQQGPEGLGPMTGRRMGRCANVGTSQASPSTEEQFSNFRGRGFGAGRRRGCGRSQGRAMGEGRGFGWQNRFNG